LNGRICSSDIQSPTSPLNFERTLGSAIAATTQNFTLSSVTPPIQCTDASGAVTTVTGGTLALSSTGKFTAVFPTETNSDGVITSGSRTEKGTFTESGSTIKFKVSGAGAFAGTIDNGTITIANYPLCGATHTAIFTQVA
jgi:hypothetical protein